MPKLPFWLLTFYSLAASVALGLAFVLSSQMAAPAADATIRVSHMPTFALLSAFNSNNDDIFRKNDLAATWIPVQNQSPRLGTLGKQIDIATSTQADC